MISCSRMIRGIWGSGDWDSRSTISGVGEMISLSMVMIGWCVVIVYSIVLDEEWLDGYLN